MSLLDFVEKDYRVRRAPNTFRQLSTLFVANIAWRRADEFRNGVLLHEFRHVEAHQRLFGAEEKFRKAPSDLSLANTRRPKEEEASDRTRRRFQSRTAAADGASERGNRLVLTNDALVEVLFDS